MIYLTFIYQYYLSLQRYYWHSATKFHQVKVIYFVVTSSFSWILVDLDIITHPNSNYFYFSEAKRFRPDVTSLQNFIWMSEVLKFFIEKLVCLFEKLNDLKALWTICVYGLGESAYPFSTKLFCLFESYFFTFLPYFIKFVKPTIFKIK